MELTHLDNSGRARMVDVSDKDATTRRAVAAGCIRLLGSTLDALRENRVQKGDVFAAARIAGIMAAKRCDDIIPLCHSLPLGSVSVDLQPHFDPPRVEIIATVTCDAQTGVEMEALMAVSVAALTIYDMVKAIDRSAVIGEIRLLEKSGGKSGRFAREKSQCQPE